MEPEMPDVTIAAIPYDISAGFFYFKSPEEFEKKSKQNLNDMGGVVEEYRFEYIDGYDEAYKLFNLMAEHAHYGPAYFDALEHMNEDDINLLAAMNDIGDARASEFGSVDEIESVVQELYDEGAMIFEGSLKDYVMESVDSAGGLAVLPIETLEYHFDWDSYTRDVEASGGYHDLGNNRILIVGG